MQLKHHEYTVRAYLGVSNLENHSNAVRRQINIVDKQACCILMVSMLH